MRTIRRLGTATAIMILVAGVAANCALPAYEAGEQSSGSGSGGKAAASSSGQGGDTSASSSSSKSSSASSSSSGGTDGGNCPEWITCDTVNTKSTPCDCFNQKCSDPQCGNAGLVLFCDSNLKVWKQFLSAPVTCCPNSPPCDPKANKLCLELPDPNKPGALKGQCVDNPCIPPMPLDCMCAHMLCDAQQTCTAKTNVIICGP